jgi:predicted acyltransferase
MEPVRELPLNMRLISLDALRGFVMFWIIGGDVIFKSFAKATHSEFLLSLVPQLEHAEWRGFHAYDLIWPLFLFTVGCAMPYAFGNSLGKGISKKVIYWKVIKRTCLLFALGMLVGGNLLAYDLSKVYLYNNTLQTIAVGYLLASLIILNLRIRWQIVIPLSALVVYWLMLVTIPVPGYGAGVLTPEGNLSIHIDKMVFGSFQHGNDCAYILPSLMFGCMVMFGALTGQLLRSDRSDRSKILWMIGTGLACLAIGWIWSEWLPFIKKIKTSSFVVYAEGWCLLFMALFYFLIDVMKHQRFAQSLVVIGVNCLAVYIATQLFQFKTIANVLVGGLEGRIGSWFEFLQAIVAFMIVWLLLFWMYRKKSFVRI